MKQKKRKFFPTESQESEIHCTEKWGEPKWIRVLPKFSGHSSSGMTGNANSDTTRHGDVSGWKCQSHTLFFYFSMGTKSLQTSRQETGMELWHIPVKPPCSHSPTSPYSITFSQTPTNPFFFCHNTFLFLTTHPKIIPT